LVLFLSGCATLPPLLDYASMALSGISYIATGKGPSDHALSFATHKDCTLLRLLMWKPICIEVNEDTNIPAWVRLLEPNPATPAADVPMPPRITGPVDQEIVRLD
jgi:hypothetical protein